MDGRLTREELDTIKANVNLLKEFKEKKVENLVGQKSKTVAKDNYLEQIKTKIKNLRKIVKGEKTSTPELQKAFGIGEGLTSSESSIIASCHLIFSAYKNNKEWCNQIDIIDADITDLETLTEKFREKDTEQEKGKKVKTSGTFDKNILQRTIEDNATHISNLGVNAFALKDSSIANLFANIIPPSDNGDKNNKEENNNKGTDSKTSKEEKD